LLTDLGGTFQRSTHERSGAELSRSSWSLLRAAAARVTADGDEYARRGARATRTVIVLAAQGGDGAVERRLKDQRPREQALGVAFSLLNKAIGGN